MTGFGSGGGMAVFESAEQTITSSSTLTVAHGLGGVPSGIAIVAICKTANNGYSVGDLVDLSAQAVNVGSTDSSFSVEADAANIILHFGSSTGVIYLISQSTRLGVYSVNANWNLILKAWL